ncbi:MAG TPA: hypothetical protein VFI73_11420 [Candidatus Nitrosopolaris sp.]|nr:hypothetical protein [Candidatus Nitrosopolaris sp.]
MIAIVPEFVLGVLVVGSDVDGDEVVLVVCVCVVAYVFVINIIPAIRRKITAGISPCFVFIE